MQSSLAANLDPRPSSTNWLGFKPATKRKIRDLERRLGVTLPPSYKDFLQVSNGWLRTTPFIGRIRPAEEVDWFRVENRQWVEVYSESGSEKPDDEYYAYSSEGAPDHRAEHMACLLQISDVDDGVYLLNPAAVTPDGEWEAWFFANWVPGAQRFPSFAHLMLSEYRSFAKLEKIDFAGVRLPTLDVPPLDVPRTSVVKKPESSWGRRDWIPRSIDRGNAYARQAGSSKSCPNAGRRSCGTSRLQFADQNLSNL